MGFFILIIAIYVTFKIVSRLFYLERRIVLKKGDSSEKILEFEGKYLGGSKYTSHAKGTGMFHLNKYKYVRKYEFYKTKSGKYIIIEKFYESCNSSSLRHEHDHHNVCSESQFFDLLSRKKILKSLLLTSPSLFFNTIKFSYKKQHNDKKIKSENIKKIKSENIKKNTVRIN